MTNFERYKDEILAIAGSGSSIALKNGVPVCCNDRDCYSCDFGYKNSGNYCCGAATISWLYAEYQEPPVDWLMVPVDTKIEVRHSTEDLWRRRYFACTDADGRACAWDEGATSFSVSCSSHYTPWEFARLYEE